MNNTEPVKETAIPDKETPLTEPVKGTTFKDFPLPKKLHRNLEQMKFVSPTPIQTLSIPPALQGKDILGTAQTGTGKTAAFGIPLLSAIHNGEVENALILAPTRELAAQIFTVLRQMGRGLDVYGALLVGGENFGRQVNDLDRGADYFVATPGRLIDHLEQGTIRLNKVEILVFDEVDRMLDMGFAPQINQIVRKIPQQRQTLLYSATLPNEIMSLANRLLYKPVRAKVGSTTITAPKITERTVRTTVSAKSALLFKELEEIKGRVLIFTRTKSRADRLTTQLQREDHKAVVLHGGRTQGQRKQALEKFRNGRVDMMIATDLAGRGIDIDDIEYIINYDLPQSREDYIHRIGRTARLGKEGNALNFLTIQDFDGESIITGKKKVKSKVYSSRRGRARRMR